jgi:hypothetical protein
MHLKVVVAPEDKRSRVWDYLLEEYAYSYNQTD